MEAVKRIFEYQKPKFNVKDKKSSYLEKIQKRPYPKPKARPKKRKPSTKSKVKSKKTSNTDKVEKKRPNVVEPTRTKKTIRRFRKGNFRINDSEVLEYAAQPHPFQPANSPYDFVHPNFIPKEPLKFFGRPDPMYIIDMKEDFGKLTTPNDNSTPAPATWKSRSTTTTSPNYSSTSRPPTTSTTPESESNVVFPKSEEKLTWPTSGLKIDDLDSKIVRLAFALVPRGLVPMAAFPPYATSRIFPAVSVIFQEKFKNQPVARLPSGRLRDSAFDEYPDDGATYDAGRILDDTQLMNSTERNYGFSTTVRLVESPCTLGVTCDAYGNEINEQNDYELDFDFTDEFKQSGSRNEFQADGRAQCRTVKVSDDCD